MESADLRKSVNSNSYMGNLNSQKILKSKLKLLQTFPVLSFCMTPLKAYSSRGVYYVKDRTPL